MAMPCAFGKLSHRHGLESFEFGELGRIEVVVRSGSMEERWRQQKLLTQQVGVGEKAGSEIDTGLEVVSSSQLQTRFGYCSVTTMEAWCKGQDQFASGTRSPGGQKTVGRASVFLQGELAMAGDP
ncbi:hypothetical protein ACHAQJ_010095 [Trichoderma viride]